MSMINKVAGKPFYVYSQNIFGQGKDFYKSKAQAVFGRVSEGKVEFSHPIRLNNWGFRDEKDYGPRVSPDEFRIVLLGDSFTVNMDSCMPWPYLLEKSLIKEFGLSVQLFNLGLTGAGPLNWKKLRNVVQKLDPDLVILGFYDGIMERPLVAFRTDENKKRFNCFYGYPLLSSRPVGICDERFPHIPVEDLERYALELEEENNSVKPSMASRILYSIYNKILRTSPLMAFNQNAVHAMLSWSPAVMLAQFPAFQSFADMPHPADPQRDFLGRLSTQRGFSLIDFRLILKDFDVNDIYTASSHHWNDKGNRLVAEVFTKELVPVIRQGRFIKSALRD